MAVKVDALPVVTVPGPTRLTPVKVEVVVPLASLVPIAPSMIQLDAASQPSTRAE